MDVQNLFRQEVLDARRASQLGRVLLATPPCMRALTIGACLATLTVAVFLCLGTYTHRSRVAGSLVPRLGLVTVRAPIAGIVTDVYMPEGQSADAHAPLAMIRVPASTGDATDARIALQAQLRQRREGLSVAHVAQQQQFDAQAAGLRERLGTADDEIARLGEEAATKRRQIAIAQETLDRFRGVAAEGYVSGLQLKQQETGLLEYTAQLQSIQRDIVQARRERAQLEQALAELGGQRRLSGADSIDQLARLEQERLEAEIRSVVRVDAPVRGVVALQLVKPGQSVEQGQPLLVLLPGHGDLEAELLVPSRAIGFVAPGDRVMLRYEAYPYQKFGHQPGTVVRISRTTLEEQPSNGRSREEPGEPLYRVNVALGRQAVTAYGKSEPLKPGMLLQADILGERRRLIEWILEPLYSLKGR